MTAFAFVRTVHVLIAVLALGLITALALPRVAQGLPSEGLRSLTARVFGALVAMFTTGVALDLLAGGAFHEVLWFRLAGASLIVAFVAAGRMVWVARRRLASGAGAEKARAQIAFAARVACALVTWVTVLMEWRVR